MRQLWPKLSWHYVWQKRSLISKYVLVCKWAIAEQPLSPATESQFCTLISGVVPLTLCIILFLLLLCVSHGFYLSNISYHLWEGMLDISLAPTYIPRVLTSCLSERQYILQRTSCQVLCSLLCTPSTWHLCSQLATSNQGDSARPGSSLLQLCFLVLCNTVWLKCDVRLGICIYRCHFDKIGQKRPRVWWISQLQMCQYTTYTHVGHSLDMSWTS